MKSTIDPAPYFSGWSLLRKLGDGGGYGVEVLNSSVYALSTRYTKLEVTG